MFEPSSDENVVNCLEDVMVYMQKMYKILTKIRQLKLTFTIEDERLINLVDQVTQDELVDLDDLKKLYEDTKVEIAELITEFEYLDSQPFEDSDKVLNANIKSDTVRYIKFFRAEKDSLLEKYFLNCYLYRNEQFNEVLNHVASLLNLVLKKISINKTAIFIQYYDDNIKRVLKANIEELDGKVESLVSHNNPESEWERLLQLTLRTSVLMNYIKSMVVSKNHNEEIFNNGFLKRKLPTVLEELRQFEHQYQKVNKELGHLDSFQHLLSEYNESAEKMKSFEGNININQEYSKDGLLSLNAVLQNYNMHKSKFETLSINSELYNSKCLSLMKNILKKNNEIYKKLKNQYFNLLVERN